MEEQEQQQYSIVDCVYEVLEILIRFLVVVALYKYIGS
jgi:hypothetical protein